MDIAALSMNMSQISLQNKVDVSIMKMVMNDNKDISESINNMIDQIIHTIESSMFNLCFLIFFII